jgi:hypothetical protein
VRDLVALGERGRVAPGGRRDRDQLGDIRIRLDRSGNTVRLEARTDDADLDQTAYSSCPRIAPPGNTVLCTLT